MDLKRALIKLDEMESAMGKLQDDIVRLKNENANLKNENANLKNENAKVSKMKMQGLRPGLHSTAAPTCRHRRHPFTTRRAKNSGRAAVKRYPEILEKRSRAARRGMGAMAAKARMAAAATATADRKRLPESGPLWGMREYLMTTSPSLPWRHALKAVACPGCHVGLSHVRPTCKLIPRP